MQIHSQEEPPYIHQLGFGVSPGFQTFVSCQEQRVNTSSWALGWAWGWAFGLRGC